MLFQSSSITAGAVLAFAAAAFGQTPAGTQPSTSKTLNVRYGSTNVNPGILLPESLVATQPTVSLNQTLNGTHMLLLVDLSIPQSTINTTGAQAPGLEPCRTTRLHWFQQNLTQTSNGTFTSTSAPIAAYGGPMPPLNDVPHTYTFYLFPQPANFSLPAWDAGRVYNPISVYARMNFSVQAIAAGVGQPLAGNYIRVQNPNNTATGTASNGTCPSSLSSNGTNGTNGTTVASPPAATYTGAATAVERGVGMVIALGVVAAVMSL